MKKAVAVFICLLFIASLSSCAGRKPKPAQEPASPSTTSVQQEEKQYTTYYDFEDIPVPKEMKLITDKSFLVEYANLKGGIMHFEGRVEPLSLFNFFYVGLQKNGWNLIGYFKYGPYILLMDKPDKECVIRIENSGWNTKLEIWITPKGVSSSQ